MRAPIVQSQVAGKGLDTAGLAQVLVAAYRQRQKKWLRQQQGSQSQSQSQAPESGQMLTALDASRNEVEGLPWSSPETCLVLYQLVELRLAHNRLQGDCSAFKPLRRLVHLGACMIFDRLSMTHKPDSSDPHVFNTQTDLSHNQLTSPAGLDGSLSQLQVLNLADNRLTEVEGLVGLPVLAQLDLSDNRLRSAQRLRLLSLNTDLRVLQLKGNPLAGNYRVAVLHLLPSIHQLDGTPCHPGRAASSSSLPDAAASSSYGSIHLPTHQRKQTEVLQRPRYARETHAEMMRRGREPRTTVGGGARAAALVAAAAAPPGDADDAGRPPTPRRDRQGFRSPPPQLRRAPPPPGYVPPWRRLPNPLPRGWRDYAGLAAQGLVGLD